MTTPRVLESCLAVIRETSVRRPVVIAAAVLLTTLALFPRTPVTQRIEMLDEAGNIAQEIRLPINDPQLTQLAAKIDRASWKKAGPKPIHYYTAKFDSELAAFYAQDVRTIPIESQPKNSVSQASYVIGDTKPAEIDWQSYWLKRRDQSSEVVAKFANQKRPFNPLENVRLAETIPGRLSVLGLFSGLSLAAGVLVLSRRFACPVEQLRIELRGRNTIVVPKSWFRVRRGYARWLRSCGRWDLLELSAGLVVVGCFCL
jgi:hypothetical protein